MPSKYRWKGKFVSDTIYHRNVKLSAIGSRERKLGPKHNLQICAGASSDKSPKSDSVYRNASCEQEISFLGDNEDNGISSSSDELAIEGCRIVDLPWLAKSMECQFCNENLSLKHIEKEIRHGLGSVLHIRCHMCSALNKITTGKQHRSSKNKRLIFDINSKIALGALHAGLGHGHINALMNTINVPGMPSTLFKRREREIGAIIEEVAMKSCQEAAIEERNLTIKNADILQKLLPENLQSGFMFPKTSDFREHTAEQMHQDITGNTENSVCSYIDESKSAEKIQISDVRSEQIEPATVCPDDIVRVSVSFDMGWSKRGTGRSYDSLNGYAAIIGTQSGKVLDYVTRNRKCRFCDCGHPSDDHDCRLNFFDTAKAMEADAAVQLATVSSILKDANIEVGVFVGDNDSSSICSIRKASDHQIIKHSDMNHTSKGVTSTLYKIDKSKDPQRELTGNAIKYLNLCFTYAAAQNKGNGAAMAAAIRNIPYHAFNRHENCGDWCGFSEDKENYDHNTVPGGFKNLILFEELKSVFGKLADNSDKFAAGASSQDNESLNAGMSKKAPKAICYSTSESADFRFAAVVCQKNEGEGYLKKVLNISALQRSPNKHLSNYIQNSDKIRTRKSEKSITKEFKLRRRVL